MPGRVQNPELKLRNENATDWQSMPASLAEFFFYWLGCISLIFRVATRICWVQTVALSMSQDCCRWNVYFTGQFPGGQRQPRMRSSFVPKFQSQSIGALLSG